MEMITLLKANIRRKKGTFFSVAFLMILISAVFTSLISVQNNYQTAVKTALEKTSDLELYFPKQVLTDEIRYALENSELTGNVTYSYGIHPDHIENPDGSKNTDDSLTADTAGIRFYNSDLSGFEERKIRKGELYVALGHRSYYGEIGDKFTVKVGENEYVLTLKGYVEYPVGGASTINGNFQFVSMDDLDKIMGDCAEISMPEKNYIWVTTGLEKAENCTLSPTKFAREICKELKDKTGVTDYNTFIKDESYKYTVLLPDILLNIVMVFAGFLFVVVLVVINHSVGSEIDADYMTIGVLKSQGFSGMKIRALFILRYLLAMMIGTIVGFIAAILIERAVGSACMSVTGVLPGHKLSVMKSGILAFFMLVICVIMIIFRTRKAAKISPVRAISGGRNEIYFNSRLHAPIAKKALCVTLAYRQITSGPGKCVGVVFIVAILTFFMVTVNLFGNILTSNVAMNAMGLDMANFYITGKENAENSPIDIEKAINEAEKLIDEKSGISQKSYRNSRNIFYNGENILCFFNKYPEDMPNISRGRAPLYDNEVLITDMIAGTYDLELGEKVKFSYDNSDEEYLICGIFQQSSNVGMVFGMNYGGGDRLGVPHDNVQLMYSFDDLTQLDEIERELNEKFGDMLNIDVYEKLDDITGIDYSAIVNMLKILIYAASLIFSFVTLRMVVSKAFTRERTDIGIFKAIGFTSNKLRLSFAIRFTLMALAGAVLGTVLSSLFAGKVLSAMMWIVGISRVNCTFDVPTLLIPAVFIAAAVFVFAFITSRKVRRVEVRELIVE